MLKHCNIIKPPIGRLHLSVPSVLPRPEVLPLAALSSGYFMYILPVHTYKKTGTGSRSEGSSYLVQLYKGKRY